MTQKNWSALWDCQYCDAVNWAFDENENKISNCPNCWAGIPPADPSKPKTAEHNPYYIPNEEDFKVFETQKANEISEAWPDWPCLYCSTTNTNINKFCSHCWVKKWKNKQIEDNRVAEKKIDNNNSQKKKSNKLTILIIALLVIWFAVWFFIFNTKSVDLTLSNSSWKAQIEVQKFSKVSDSDWRWSIPHNAYNIRYKKEVHHHDSIADWQSCSLKNNWNWSVSEVCTTNYKKVPVYKDKWYYKIDKWIRYKLYEKMWVNRTIVFPEISIKLHQTYPPRLWDTRKQKLPTEFIFEFDSVNKIKDKINNWTDNVEKDDWLKYNVWDKFIWEINFLEKLMSWKAIDNIKK
jgi:hypothetical protein